MNGTIEYKNKRNLELEHRLTKLETIIWLSVAVGGTNAVLTIQKLLGF